MKLGRRGFFKVAAVTAGAAGASAASATAGAQAVDDGPAVLVDTTLCVGCRACEAACSEANGLPPPAEGTLLMPCVMYSSTSSRRRATR